jgi:hypothetical protein
VDGFQTTSMPEEFETAPDGSEVRPLRARGAPDVTQEPEDGVGDFLCLDLVGIRDVRGFWSSLSEEQRDELVSAIEVLIEEGVAYEGIRDMIAGKLQEWGIEPSLFSGPHYGGNGGRGPNGPNRGFGGHGFGGKR